MDPETIADTQTVAAPDDAELPGLDGLAGIRGIDGGTVGEFQTTYFDTAELTLAAAGITLLHRSGDEAGWRLELPTPDGGAAVLLRVVGGRRDTVPAELRKALRLHTRKAKLSPVGRTTTERRRLDLRDESDTTVARLHDERTTADGESADVGTHPTWRQWVVEPIDNTTQVADEVAALLRTTGGGRSDGSPEIARVLGDRMPERIDRTPPQLRKKSSAADVVGAHLRTQAAELEHWDVLARWDAPDSIHKLRVATRRLRSALKTFRPLLDRDQSDPVRDELKWIAGVLGEVRDVEVAREYLTGVLADEPPELVVGAVSQHIERVLSDEFDTARERALEAMQSARYFLLLDRLRALVDDPPWNPRAAKPARKVLPDLIADGFKRLRKEAAAVADAPDPGSRGTQLHEVRKAAKRARYAAEAVAPVFGAEATQFAEAAERLQEVLGDHHDAVTLLPRIRELGMQAHLDGENAFTFGRLHGLEQKRIADREAEYADAWEGVSAKGVRRWLK